MSPLYTLPVSIFLSLIACVVSLQAQWDPQGDARLFSYVFPYPGHYINDHSLIRVDSLWHLYFIDGTVGGGYWDRPGNEVRIGHATSPDLLSWTPRDSALGVGDSGALDMAHVYAPSVIESNGTYYMFYTGNEASYHDGEHMFLATSTDLYTWRRYQKDPIFRPDRSWAAYHPDDYPLSSGGPISGRDPYVVYDERHGYILYYVARLRSSDPGLLDSGYSCIAAATSPDLINWTDRGPLVVVKTEHLEQGTTWNHPESPCLVRHGDLYYLFWKGGPGTRYVMSDDPLDFTGAGQHRLATSHSSKIVQWGKDWYITSCSRDVSDITHEFSDRIRGLFLARLRWEGLHPRVVPLDVTSGWRDAARQHEPLIIPPGPVERGTIVPITLPAKSRAGEYEVSVVDIQGREVSGSSVISRRDASGSYLVDLPTEGLAPGVYFVRVGGIGMRLVVL